jgi:hypothetical protein
MPTPIAVEIALSDEECSAHPGPSPNFARQPPSISRLSGEWRLVAKGAVPAPTSGAFIPGKALARQSRSSAAAHRQSESAIRVAENVEAIVSESLQFRALQGSQQRRGCVS